MDTLKVTTFSETLLKAMEGYAVQGINGRSYLTCNNEQ